MFRRWSGGPTQYHWTMFGLCGILVPFVGIGSVNAGFQLVGPAVSPLPAPEPPASPSDRPPRQVHRPAGPAIAQGFGTQVPLVFAARQIVPHGFKIAFGADLDAGSLLVDWKGGRPWPDVLRATLLPAGLQVTFHPGTVLIERSSAL